MPEQPSTPNTIVTGPLIQSELGRESIDAATLAWRLGSTVAVGEFGFAFSRVTGRDGQPRYLTTRAKQLPNGLYAFAQEPPSLLIYTSGEVNAFLGGAGDGEFDDLVG